MLIIFVCVSLTPSSYRYVDERYLEEIRVAPDKAGTPDRQGCLEMLSKAPIMELNIVDASFRRGLVNLGFTNIAEVLRLTDAEIDSHFKDDDENYQIYSLKKRFERNPGLFTKNALKKRLPTDVAAVLNNRTSIRTVPDQLVDVSTHPASRDRSGSRSHASSNHRRPTSIPMLSSDNSLHQRLRYYEQRARKILDGLMNMEGHTYVFQVFDEFEGEFDSIYQVFTEFIDHFKWKMDVLIYHFEHYYPTAYLVFFSHLAQDNYEDGRIWDPFFERVGIEDDRTRHEMKHLYLRLLEQRGMPVFNYEEQQNYYVMSALLHGGFSEDAWESLWRDSILPFAKSHAEALRESVCVATYNLIDEMLEPHSKIAPVPSVLVKLRNTPKGLITPLFANALEMLRSHVGPRGIGDTVLVVADNLPEVSLTALSKVVGRNRGGRGDRKTSMLFVQRPKAWLELDLDEGTAVLHWERKRFPREYLGARVSYRLNDRMLSEQEIVEADGQVVLEELRVPVGASMRFDVSMEIRRPSKTEDVSDSERFSWSFKRTRPKAFEFVRIPNGIYRLRGTVSASPERGESPTW